METKDNYYRGLLFLSFALISSEREISDNELCHVHKMRVEEGISDEVFSSHFSSLLGKSGKELYQIGIDSMSECSKEFKLKALSRLLHLAQEERIVNHLEIQAAFHSAGVSTSEIQVAVRKLHKHSAAA